MSTNIIRPFTAFTRNPSFSMLLCMAVCVALMAGQATGGETKCPRYRVVLDGMIVNPGPTTYREHIVMHKVGLGKGYDGQWQIDKITWTMVFPRQQKPGLNFSGPLDFTLGNWMNCTQKTQGNTVCTECIDGKLLLDVVNNKVGSRKTNVWVGEIRGNRMTLVWDKSNPYLPVNAGVITEGPGTTISLTVTSPKTGKRYVYSSNSPGELKVELTARTKPAKYSNKIQWAIPEIKDVKCTKTPDPPVGSKVTVIYSGLPKKNSEFGEKTIVAELDVSGCKVKEEVDIKVFFPRDAKNNPDGKDPNWFFYWVQTSAATLGSKARYNGFKCTQEGGTGVDTLGYYPPFSLPDHYYICDIVQVCGTEMKFKARVWEFKVKAVAGEFHSKVVTTTGIDTLALVSLHEAEHYAHLRKWWLNIDKFKRAQEDEDRDDIPDKVEKNLFKNGIRLFDPQKLHTYPGTGIDDEELYTELEAHEKLKLGAAGKEDWAYPGKQWK